MHCCDGDESSLKTQRGAGMPNKCRFSDQECVGVASERGEMICKDCKILRVKARKVEVFIRQWKPSNLAIAAAKEK